MRLLRPALPLLLLASVAAAPLAAQERVVIYRCAGADGAVTVQNDRPCPAGTTRLERRVIQAPQPAAPPTAAPDAAPAVIPSAPSPGTAPAAGSPGSPATGVATPPDTAPAGDTPAPPATATPTAAAPPALATVPGVAPTAGAAPPPLYECRVFDGAVYLGENPSPPPRCAPLATTSIGAAPAAGSACQVVRDECTPVPAAALCERWRDRLRALESALTFGRLDERETASVEIDRVRTVVEDSACGS